MLTTINCPICEEGTLLEVIEEEDGTKHSVCTYCKSEQVDYKQLKYNLEISLQNTQIPV